MTTPPGAFLVYHPIPTIESTWETRALQARGSTHTHTTESDGVLTPTEIEATYAALGHDWIAITDHGARTADPAGLPNLGGEELATGVAWPANPHIVGLGLAATIEDVDSAQTNINAVLAAGGIAVLAHPLDDSYHQALTGYTHMEIDWNAGYQGEPVKLWDRKLTEGERPFAVIGDDAHYAYDDGDASLTVDSRGSTVCNVDTVTSASVLAAIRSGNCYVTSGTFNGTGVTAGITSISVADGTITIAVPQQSNVYWYGSNGGSLGSALGVTSDTYRPRGNEIYVRIKVVPTADTTRFALSQPIWITP